jgi:hypothetical protein
MIIKNAKAQKQKKMLKHTIKNKNTKATVLKQRIKVKVKTNATVLKQKNR